MKHHSEVHEQKKNQQEQNHHHHHAGMSSRLFLNAESILKQLGDISGKTIVDIGCGDGYFSVAVSDLAGVSGKVYAIDVDEPSINSLNNEIKQKSIRNITTILSDFTKGTEIMDNSVDICLMVNVFHGFVVNGEVEKVIGEISRIITHPGILLIVEFKKIPDTPGPTFNDRLSSDELEKILGSYGFTKNKKFEAGPLHYAVIFSH